MRLHRLARCRSLALACAVLLGACSASSGDPLAVSEAAKAGGVNEHGLARLRNPLAGDADAIAAGRSLFASKACAGCHGAEAGGGMCPSLVDGTWVYGDDDTTLYHLIREGSAGMRAHGYARGDAAKIVGDMPPLGSAVSEQEAWQLLAWIRSHEAAARPATR